MESQNVDSSIPRFYDIYDKFDYKDKIKLEQFYINPFLGKEKVNYLQWNYGFTSPDILPQPHSELVDKVGFYERNVLL